MAKVYAQHSFSAFDDFRQLVDSALATLDTDPVPENLRLYPSAYDAIKSIFPIALDDGQNQLTNRLGNDLSAVLRQITYSHFLQATSLEPYYSCASTLFDALRQQKITEATYANSTKWIEAARIAIEYTRDRNNKNALPSQRIQFKQATLALSIKYFNSKKIPLSMEGDTVKIPSEYEKSCTAIFQTPLLSLGDTNCISFVDHLIRQRYNPNLRRLSLHAHPDSMGSKTDRQIPYGLLYRYSLKSIGKKRIFNTKENAISRIIESSKNLAALYDVEPFSIYETMWPCHLENQIETLNSVTTFDALFSIPQCPPKVVNSLIEMIRDDVHTPTADNALGWSAKDALQLFDLLLTLSQHDVGSTFLSRDLIRRNLIRRVGLNSADALLKAFGMKNINANYFYPSDAKFDDTRECCIAEATGDRYWIPGKLLLGQPFFARFIRQQAKHETTFNDQLGNAFEKHLINRLRCFGISCTSGKLIGKNKSNIAGDIDLLIESNDIIGLFEIKKKTLCQASVSGTGTQLIIDIAEGLLKGLTQISRHEITLLRDKQLNFEDGSSLKLNDRRIIKCVISLGDFGGLHDAMVIRNMLQNLTGRSINADNLTEQQVRRIDSANKLLSELLNQYQEFESIKNSESRKNIFDNFLFRNIFFIEYLVAQTRNAEGFLKALSIGNHVVTGTRDPFIEHAQLSRKE